MSEEERTLLQQLSVFAGGWTLEAAEQVCASDVLESDQVLDLLLTLVDKCLVVARTNDPDPRYSMLETIRQYAQEKLDESDNSSLMRDRHLEYFFLLAEQGRPHFRDAEQFLWLDRFEAELDNVRAALTWSLQGGSVEAGLRLAANLGVDTGAFWVNRGHMQEGHEYLEQLLLKSQATGPIEGLAAGYFSITALEFWLHDFAAALSHVEQSESLWTKLGRNYKARTAEATVLKITIYSHLDPAYDPIKVCQQYQEILPTFRETGDHWMTAHILFGVAFHLQESGDLTGARQTFEQSRALFRECGDGLRVSKDNVGLALIAMQEGRYVEAHKLCEETLPSSRQLRFALRDEPLWILGAISIIEGNFADAKAWYTECLLFDQEISFYSQLPECCIGFASIAAADAHFERAAKLVGAAEQWVSARQARLEGFDQAELEKLTNMLREKFGNETFARFSAEGRAMTLEQVIAFALDKID